jgi:hypothetical protein
MLHRGPWPPPARAGQHWGLLGKRHRVMLREAKANDKPKAHHPCRIGS